MCTKALIYLLCYIQPMNVAEGRLGENVWTTIDPHKILTFGCQIAFVFTNI